MWRMPHATLVNLLWTWLLLESQKKTVFCDVSGATAATGVQTALRNIQTIASISPRVKSDIRAVKCQWRWGFRCLHRVATAETKFESQTSYISYPCQYCMTQPLFNRRGWEREMGCPEVDSKHGKTVGLILWKNVKTVNSEPFLLLPISVFAWWNFLKSSFVYFGRNYYPHWYIFWTKVISFKMPLPRPYALEFKYLVDCMAEFKDEVHWLKCIYF